MKIALLFFYVLLAIITNSDCNGSTTSYGNNGGFSQHIATLIVSEFSMQEFHKEEVTRYLATIVQLVNEIFNHESLKLDLKVLITSIVLMDELESSSVIVENSKMRSLQRACYWAARRQSDIDSDDNRFQNDLVLFFTRKNFGAVGYSPANGMCNGRKSCSLIRDVGFRTAFVIAHEIGHLMGLMHDDACSQDAVESSVMATTIKSTFTSYHWTNCSQSILLDTTRHFSCLNNKPFNINNTDGCAYVTGKNTTACPWYTEIDDSCVSGVCVLKNHSQEQVTPLSASPSTAATTRPSTSLTTDPLDTTPTRFVTVPPEPQPGYIWESIGWTECSSSCGGGATYHEYQCRSLSDKTAITTEGYCNREGFQPYAKECNTHSCRPIKKDRPTFRWKSAPWSECRAECGAKGKKTRNVKCIRSVNGKNKSVNKASCKKISDMPAKKKSCTRTCSR